MNDFSTSTIADELEACRPTPVVPLGNLFVKNDGLTGLSYGGNKVRKLVPLFAKLRAQGRKRILTMGAAGSHHVLANALFARRSGFSCAALVFPQVFTPHAADMLRLASVADVTLHPCRSPMDVARALARESAKGTAWTGPGALGPCAASGYENAFDEWVAQRPSLDLRGRYEHHVVAAGSGGTAAGILAGLVKHRLRGRVVAVAVNHNLALRPTIIAQASGVERLGEGGPSWHLNRNLHVDFSAVGLGYGHPTQDSTRAIEQAAQVGLHLEHTYTAKAYSVAQALATSRNQDVVVFWQTFSQAPLPQLADAPPLDRLEPALRRLLRFD